MFTLTEYNITPKPILISMNTHCLSISVYCHCSPCRYSSRSRYRGLSVWTHLYCKCRIVTDTDVLTAIKNMSAKLLVWVALLSRTPDSKTSRQRPLSPTERQGSILSRWLTVQPFWSKSTSTNKLRNCPGRSFFSPKKEVTFHKMMNTTSTLPNILIMKGKWPPRRSNRKREVLFCSRF